MKIFRKLITITLAVSMLIGCCPAFAANTNDEDEDTLTNLFIDLGIYSVEDNMDFGNEPLLREEMASILSVFFDVTENEYAIKTNIPDVPQYWASGHIMTVMNAGVMTGFLDGLFRPQQPVTVEQTVAALVKLTGYEPYAEAKGGYPTGYFTAAARSGITRDVELGDKSANITKKLFTELLYNAVNAPLFKTTSITQGADGEFAVYEADNYATLLSENLNIYKDNGVVEGLPYTTLSFAAATEDTICIDNTIYDYYGDAYEFLGENVNFYYNLKKGELKGRVLHLEKTDNVRNLTIEAEDIISATTSSITYAVKNNSHNIVLPSDVVVIFNGQRLTYYTAEHLKPKQGSVKLVDADKNGTYEAVIVDYEMNYIVQSISIDEKAAYIIDRDGKATIKIDLEKDHYQIYDRGRSLAIDELAKDDVISVCADSVNISTKAILQTSSVYRIYVSKEIMEGTVSTISNDSVKIDGIKYDTVWDINKTKNVIAAGQDSVFYLNYEGKIAGVKEEATSTYNYGILKDGYEDGDFQVETTLRLYDQSGQFVILKCAPKMTIDGKSKSEYTAGGKTVLDYLKTSSTEFNTQTGLSVPADGIWQMVRYTCNNEVITKLDTILTNTNVSADDLTYSGKTADSNIMYAGTAGNLDRKYALTDDTLFFNVSNDKEDMDFYSIAKPSTNTMLSGPFVIFNMDDELNVKVLLRIVSNSYTIKSTDFSSMMIVEEILTQMNADGDVATYIGGTLVQTGQYKEVELKDSSLLTDKGIAEGDIIRWAGNANGVAQIIDKSFSPDGSGTLVTAGQPYGNLYNGLAYGEILTCDSEKLRIQYDCLDPANNYIEPMKIPSTVKILLYDTVQHETRPATAEDMRSTAAYGSDADMIVVYRYEISPRTFIIYR